MKDFENLVNTLSESTYSSHGFDLPVAMLENSTHKRRIVKNVTDKILAIVKENPYSPVISFKASDGSRIIIETYIYNYNENKRNSPFGLYGVGIYVTHENHYGNKCIILSCVQRGKGHIRNIRLLNADYDTDAYLDIKVAMSNIKIGVLGHVYTNSVS